MAIPSLSLLFLQNRQVQTKLSQALFEKVSESIDADISLTSINYTFFKRVQVRDLLIRDIYGDTLIFSELTKVRIKSLRSEKKGVVFKKIAVENTWVNLVIDDFDTVNIAYITKDLSNPHNPPEKKGRLHIEEISLSNGRFSLSNKDAPPTGSEVNFNDFHLEGLEIIVEDLISEQDTVSMDIISLSATEKRGFDFTRLSTFMSIGKQHMHFYELDVSLPRSELHVPKLTFNFPHWNLFKYFSREVDLGFESESSVIHFKDLFAFVPGEQRIDKIIRLDGKVDGTLNNFHGDDMIVGYNENMSLAFDYLMIGLPDFKNTFMDISIKDFNTSYISILEVLRDTGITGTPYPWANLGNLDFKGQFTGYYDNFVASGLLHTDMGPMIMDLAFRPDTLNVTGFRGHLTTADFQLGTFLEQKEILGEVDMDVMVDGSLANGVINAALEGTIDTLDFSDYTYSNIILDGALSNTTFNGGFSIDDPNLRMDFNGMLDFQNEVPEFNFKANVEHSYPYYLNLDIEDSTTFASFIIETDMKGLKLNEMNGEVRLINSMFERNDVQVQLYGMSLQAINTPDTASLKLESDLFRASLNGSYQLSTLPSAFHNLADKYLDIDPEKEYIHDTINKFDLRAELYHVNPIFDFFFPDFQLGDSSYVSGTYFPESDSIELEAFFPDLHAGPVTWSGASILAEELDNEFNVHFNSDSLLFGQSYTLENQQFHLFSKKDTAHFYMEWDNYSDVNYSGLVKLRGAFIDDSLSVPALAVEILPSNIFIRNEMWSIHDASVLLRPAFVDVDSFLIGTSDKHILADGIISRDGDKSFDIDLLNLNLKELSGISGVQAELGGEISGDIQYTKQDNVPYLFTDLAIDTLFFNEQLIGPSYLNASWNEAQELINLDMHSVLEQQKTIGISGDFRPEDGSLDFEFHLNDFNLAALEPYLEGVAHELDGQGNIDLTLDGYIDNPIINGTILFNEAGATVDFLNTHYTFSDLIRVYNSNLFLNDFTLLDEDGNTGLVNGSITHENFEHINIGMNIRTDNLLCMDTKATDNEVFYGRVYATGDVGFRGSKENMSLNINARTERNTAFYFPLYNAREVQDNDFITFISESSDLEAPPLNEQLSGLDLDLEIDITEDAVVQLIFDPKVGDIIETSGRGNVRIVLDQDQGFRMFGDVELVKGDYLFTLQNVINKKFEIEPGGKINFAGSPTNASIDLEAIYGTRVAPYNLYPGDPSEESSLNKRIPVECRLALQGELQSPTIFTDIEMPTADPETRDLLENATSTEEELMKQFLSLLVINNFYSVSGYGTGNISNVNANVAGVTASELLSNQLSNWLSQINENFDVGFNYRPGDEVSSSEIELALSTQLLNDRVIISGNVDYIEDGTNPSTGQSGNPYIMGDVEVEYKVTENVSVLAFNRARDELLFQTAPYKQGVGLSYREDFNSLKQLMKRYRDALANRKKRKNKKSASTESDD